MSASQTTATAGETSRSAPLTFLRWRGWRRAFVAIGCGAASVLAFAPWHLPVVLFLTLPVLVWLIDEATSPKDAALVGWLFGFGYFLLNLFWIGEAFLVEAEKFAVLLPFAVTLLPAGLALFWAAGAALCKRLWPAGLWRVLLLATVFTALEWLRGHVLTGLPWNVLGYALTSPMSWMQSAALLGAYGLTFPAFLLFAAPLVFMRASTGPVWWRGVIAVALGGVPLLALTAYGAWRLAAPSPPDVAGVKLRVVQPSVPQREKWMSAKQAEIFNLHLRLTTAGPDGQPDGAAGITHVIWPEAAMPFLPLETPEALKAIADTLPPGVQLISGAIRREAAADGRPRGYNSILVFDSDAKLRAVYDKVHLVPFGEYLPLERLLSALGLSKLTHGLGSFDVGPLPPPLLTVPGLPPLGGLICYEALFPGHVVDAAHRPGALVNVTNDGWFGDTSGPRQHFHQARVRAVEEGLPLIRAANNGISAVVDAYGHVRASAGMNEVAVLDTPLPAALDATPYARYGDGPLGLMLGLASVLLAAQAQRARRRDSMSRG